MASLSAEACPKNGKVSRQTDIHTMTMTPLPVDVTAKHLVLLACAVCGLALPLAPVARAQSSADGTMFAQRVTKPGEPAPPPPPPPPTEPRSGVMEAPKASGAEPPTTPAAPKATTTPAEAATATELLRIIFPANNAALPGEATPALDKLVEALKAKTSMRVLLKAYSSTGTSVSEMRRLSLQRGMAVRLYLIDKGIAATRIDLQPLGNSTDGGPGDRVDVFPGRS